LSFTVLCLILVFAEEEEEEEEEQLEEDIASDDDEGLRAGMAGMNVGRGATITEDGTIIQNPSIVAPMMPLIPPVPFYDPELGYGVEMVFLLFSGTCREDLRCTVQPGGQILSVRWTWPEFILDSTRPEAESRYGADIFHVESTASQLGVCRLRPQEDEPVHVTMNYELPMRCEEMLPDGAVEFLAYENTHPEHSGQHAYYLKVRLRGIRKGARAPSIPIIRVVRPRGPPPPAGSGRANNNP
jgi:hypothetical protein